MSLIDLNGNKLFSKKFSGWQINGISANSDGSLFLIPLHKYEVKHERFIFRTLLLDNLGNIRDMNKGVARKITPSTEGNR